MGVVELKKIHYYKTQNRVFKPTLGKEISYSNRQLYEPVSKFTVLFVNRLIAEILSKFESQIIYQEDIGEVIKNFENLNDYVDFHELDESYNELRTQIDNKEKTRWDFTYRAFHIFEGFDGRLDWNGVDYIILFLEKFFGILAIEMRDNMKARDHWRKQIQLVDFEDVLSEMRDSRNILSGTITLYFEEESEPETTPDDKVSVFSTFKDSNIDVERIKKSLFRKGQIILMGPPGTSKSFFAELLGKEIVEKKEQFHKVQFHPDYSYEDFVEGLDAKTIDGHLTFVPTKKIFRLVCDDASKLNKDEYVVLLIDEINRGNVEKIFGELIWSLENRDEEVKSLYFKDDPLKIPKNLLIIATMNTVDLSIVNIDAALLRRFHIIEFMPDSLILTNWLKDRFKDKFMDFQNKLLSFMDELNEIIKANSFLGLYRTLGHTYFFVEPKDTVEELEEDFKLEWECAIRPLLLNYLNFDPEMLKIYDELFDKIMTD